MNFLNAMFARYKFAGGWKHSPLDITIEDMEETQETLRDIAIEMQINQIKNEL